MLLQVCLENWSLCQILRRGGLGRDDNDGRTWFLVGTLGYQIVVQARLFFLEEKSHLHKLIRTCTFINFKDFSHLHVYLLLFTTYLQGTFIFSRGKIQPALLFGTLEYLRLFNACFFITTYS